MWALVERRGAPQYRFKRILQGVPEGVSPHATCFHGSMRASGSVEPTAVQQVSLCEVGPLCDSGPQFRTATPPATPCQVTGPPDHAPGAALLCCCCPRAGSRISLNQQTQASDFGSFPGYPPALVRAHQGRVSAALPILGRGGSHRTPRSEKGKRAPGPRPSPCFSALHPSSSSSPSFTLLRPAPSITTHTPTPSLPLPPHSCPAVTGERAPGPHPSSSAPQRVPSVASPSLQVTTLQRHPTPAPLPSAPASSLAKDGPPGAPTRASTMEQNNEGQGGCLWRK